MTRNTDDTDPLSNWMILKALTVIAILSVPAAHIVYNTNPDAGSLWFAYVVCFFGFIGAAGKWYFIIGGLAATTTH